MIESILLTSPLYQRGCGNVKGNFKLLIEQVFPCMRFSEYTTKTRQELLDDFAVSDAGLSRVQVLERQKDFGLNKITVQQATPWELVARQFTSPFAYLLIGAAALSFLLSDRVNATLILVIVFINALIGFVQEYRAHKALEKLRKYIIFHARVVRDGLTQVVSIEDIVPGDIVLLGPADRIPADVRFIDVHDLVVDESALTGESIGVHKTAEPLPSAAQEIYQAANMGFSGTKIIEGSAKAIVTATGDVTSFGDISRLAFGLTKESNFQRNVAQFSRLILYMVICTIIVIVITHLIIKPGAVNIYQLFLFAIALAVTVTPEALPIVTTVSLARGALSLAENHVIVKRLSAIEDLGSIELLGVDKTGTLTENRLSVGDILEHNKQDALLFTALASGNLLQPRATFDQFDAALVQALSSQQKEALKTYRIVTLLPFDYEKKISNTLLKKDSHYLLLVRGIFEVVLELCPSLTADDKANALAWAHKQGTLGRLVLTTAIYTADEPIDPTISHDLKFVGMVSFEDPIKLTVHDALAKAQELAIQIKVISGDSKEAVGAVAYAVRLVGSPSRVISGDEFNKLSFRAKNEAVKNYSVFARISPRQKYDIVMLLKHDYKVGYLGDGINDAPALKAADVGIVVQKATDIAQEIADVVLLKKSLLVIVNGIYRGRTVFINTTNYLKTTLASTFGNFYTIAFVSLFIDFLPLLPLQLLVVNLISDFPMIAIATDNVDIHDLKRPTSYNVKGIVKLALLFGALSTIFDFVFFFLFVRKGPAILRTNLFIESIMTELVLIYSLRSELPFYKAQRPSLTLLLLSLSALAFTLALPFSYFGQRFLSLVRPSSNDLSIIASLVAVYFVANEVMKLIYYRQNK